MLGSTCFGHHYAHNQEAHDDSVGYHIGLLVLEALNFQPAATRAPDGLCGNQRYRREPPDDGHNGDRNMLSLTLA